MLLELILQYGDEDVFANVRVVYQLLSEIAVSVASSERSFSKLNLMLTYLKLTLDQERLGNLALMSIEHE